MVTTGADAGRRGRPELPVVRAGRPWGQTCRHQPQNGE